MKKEFYFRSTYELVTNIMSETMQCSIAELQERIDMDAKSKDINWCSPVSIYANIHTFCVPIINQMEIFRMDLFMSIMMRCTNALKSDIESDVETLEYYVRSIVGLDTYVCEYDDSKADPIRIGFHYELSGSDDRAKRMKATILLEAIESIIENASLIALDNYAIPPILAFKNNIEEILDSHGGRIEDYDPIKEAKRILGLE